MERPIVIEDREELIYMLCEASELEHMIMCEYLFAAFSLKHDVSEGLTAAQVEAVRRWERIISGVATQEMLHLALASNLLTAIGASPHLGRPNLPQRARYYPPGVQLALLPFSEQALQHFIYLERPEGMTLADAPGFEVTGAAVPAPAMDLDQIVPHEQDFSTVGHLYRGIEQGFRHLVARYGERQIFVGPPQAQATQQYFRWPALIPVTDLASAVAAIETIVEQGEGARGDWKEAHYGTFLGILDEYRALKQQDPGFAPARPVLAAYVRPPSDVSEVTLITDPVAAHVADLFNAGYEVLLQLLGRFFAHGEETEAELQTLSTAAISLMVMVLKPLGRLLTTLPVGPHVANVTAGPSFQVYRTGYLLPHRAAAWMLLQERLGELATYCVHVAAHPSLQQDLTRVEGTLQRLAAALGPHGGVAG